jgi:hypothetical protein
MSAFVMRIKPSHVDRTLEALATGDLIIGWSKAPDLLNSALTRDDFKRILHNKYYRGEKGSRRSGKAAGTLWRFLREMAVDDLVVVPHRSKFFVGKVDGPPRFLHSKASEDSAFRRKVRWLNGADPIARADAPPALRAKMRSLQTCVDATPVLPDIRAILSKRSTSDRAAAPRPYETTGPRGIQNDSGTKVDATFSIERSGGVLTLVLEARGGTKGTVGARNTQYQEGFCIILTRLAHLNARIADALVDSEATRTLPLQRRRLKMPGRPYPLGIDDPTGIQRLLGRAQAAVGRAKNAMGYGNPTKRVRVFLSFPGGDRDPNQLARFLSNPKRATIKARSLSRTAIGTKYRKADENPKHAPRQPFEIDPEVIERGIKGHAITQNLLAEFLRENKIKPHSCTAGEPEYDLAWKTKTRHFVAEVKSTTYLNSEKQLRLGLGQVLRYRHVLAQRLKLPVTAVLVAEREPFDSTWPSTCAELGVLLVWPASFERILVQDHEVLNKAVRT